MDLVVTAYELAEKLPRSERFGLGAQIRRAAVSIPSNVAEGHAAGARQRYLNHVRIAAGSLAELDTQIDIATRLAFLSAEDVGIAAQQLTRQASCSTVWLALSTRSPGIEMSKVSVSCSLSAPMVASGLLRAPVYGTARTIPCFRLRVQEACRAFHARRLCMSWFTLFFPLMVPLEEQKQLSCQRASPSASRALAVSRIPSPDPRVPNPESRSPSPDLEPSESRAIDIGVSSDFEPKRRRTASYNELPPWISSTS